MDRHLHFYPEQEKTVAFKPRVVFSGTLHVDENWVSDVHMHNFCEILYITAGEGVINIENKQYEIRAGDIVVYDSGVFHEERCKGGGLSMLFFAIDSLRIPGMADGCIVPIGACPVIESGGYDDVLKVFLSVMVEELNKKKQYYKAISNSLAKMFCYYVLRLYGIKIENPEHTEISNKAKQYIEQNYQSDINLDTFAGSIHISKYHFIRIFKEATGISPMKWLLFVRLSAAKNLLARTEMSIGEIAEAVGYKNAHTFSRVFRKSENISPSEYRSNAKEYSMPTVQ
jgi:AraC-like DNA-binding protein/mannose-6-phosphate isomerase-like protein (cupin superfamily)